MTSAGLPPQLPEPAPAPGAPTSPPTSPSAPQPGWHGTPPEAQAGSQPGWHGTPPDAQAGPQPGWHGTPPAAAGWAPGMPPADPGAGLEKRQRLHPLSPLLSGAKSIVVIVAALSWQTLRQLGPTHFAMVVAVLAIGVVIFSVIGWWSTG